MREAAFVDQNQKKWLAIEENLRNRVSVNPEELASNYIELTNDLAYAQTFYPSSKTKEYLNELSIFAHQSIYKDQRSTSNQFFHFFKYEVPRAVYNSRKQLLYSFLIFVLAILIGIISAHYDKGFVRLILGNSYVDTTIENIKAGNPAAIYNSGGEIGTTLAITINNVRVAFMAFALGIFLGIGTAYILLVNGVMLGAFHYMFYEHGVLQKAMSAIWIHGAFEISVIVIAGACGLLIGKGILFPKTYTRLDSFKYNIKNAGTILISTIPFFIIAGFLEGFVTRHYQFSFVLSSLVAFFSLLIIILYYIVLPIKLSKPNQWNN